MKSWLLLVSTCLFVCLDAFALCFEPSRPCSWYAVHHGGPTFIGTAISEQTVSDVLELGGHKLNVTVQRVTFHVDEPFEGTSARTEMVYGEGTTNDFHFKVGEKYLVYGWREKDGKIRTARCTRTSVVSQAKEDIQFLRSLPNQHGGTIFGTVRFLNSRSRAGALSGTVSEFGPDGEHKARVSASGSYELTGLVPGDYREILSLDGSRTGQVNLKVRLPVNGSCVESGFVVR